MNEIKAIENIYKERESFAIIGLTGRTGSGCSTVAEILSRSFDSLSLRATKEYDYTNADERKFKVLHDFMSERGKWKAFSIIEMSSIILDIVLEMGKDPLIDFLDGLQKEENNPVINIPEYRDLKAKLGKLSYTFEEAEKFKLLDVKLDDIENVDQYHNYYTKTLLDNKKRIKELLSGYSCTETQKPETEGQKRSKLHLYTYLFQQFGNNIRASGNPYSLEFSDEHSFTFLKKVKTLIDIISTYDKNNKKIHGYA